MDDLAERAGLYATSAHARINHLRKYSMQPYDVHLKAVAEIVASVTDDQALIASAWLHDTVEDTPATFDDLEREFGADVMNLVKELTEVSKPGDGNRAMRKAIERQFLAGVSPRAKTVKLADIIDNCDDICRHDPKFGRVYLAEMQSLLQVLTEGDQRLYARAVKTVTRCAAKLGVGLAEPCTTDIQVPVGTDSRPAVSGQHGLSHCAGAFSARDIHEPLVSFDDTSLPGIAHEAGSRSDAQVVGRSIARATCAGASLNSFRRAFPPVLPT
jgi:hypothetical protein